MWPILGNNIGERSAGRLLVRITSKGVARFYFRYSVPGRDRILLPLEVFSYAPKTGAMTLEPFFRNKRSDKPTQSVLPAAASELTSVRLAAFERLFNLLDQARRLTSAWMCLSFFHLSRCGSHRCSTPA